MFSFVTAGESHGKGLVVILQGIPAGLPLQPGDIHSELQRRQKGYGRGGRMAIEKDEAEVLSGIRHGETLGGPIALFIRNRDWVHWEKIMDAWHRPPRGSYRVVDRPRPGHADLSGALKYERKDIRDILERASARETAARVAAGAVAKQVLRALRIELGSWVCALGGVSFPEPPGSLRRIAMRAERSDVSCPDERAAQKMRAAIDAAKAQGDTLGGVIRLFAEGLVPGLGSHVQWDQRLDMRIAGALMSIQAIKGVEFGLGFAAAALPGSRVHDPIAYRSGKGFYRDTNHAGGVEGGMTTGEPLKIQMAMKPIATLKQPLPSVHLRTKRPLAAGYERSDVCAVPAAAVVGEAMLAMELLKVVQEKFGGDTLRELRVRYQENQKNV